MLKLRAKLGEWQRRLSTSFRTPSPRIAPRPLPIIEASALEDDGFVLIKQEPTQVVTPTTAPSAEPIAKPDPPVERKSPVPRDTLYSQGSNAFTAQVRAAYAFKGVELEFVSWDRIDLQPSYFPAGTLPVIEHPSGRFSHDPDHIISTLITTHQERLEFYLTRSVQLGRMLLHDMNETFSKGAVHVLETAAMPWQHQPQPTLDQQVIEFQRNVRHILELVDSQFEQDFEKVTGGIIAG
ncbi:hypothetical protein HDU99_010120, partial [Rhizoclosmatium hyalinum]